MRMFQVLKRSLGAAAAMGLMATQANAALDPGVSTAISDGKADALALGALVIGVIIAIAAIKWLRKAL